jgi:hypothetical protein
MSKLAAGRLKDLELVGALLKTRLATESIIRRRIRRFPLGRDRARIRRRLRSVLDELTSSSPVAGPKQRK